jgi:ribosomal protein L30/L7E
MAATKKIRIQYYRSKIATPTKHKLVVKGLGFTRLNQIVERVDNGVHSRHGEGRAAFGEHSGCEVKKVTALA